MRTISDGERAILAQDGPEDDMGDQVLSYRHVRAAAKAHGCDGCPDGQILPGENYHQWATLDEFGQFHLMRFCRGLCRKNGHSEGIKP